VDQVSFTQMQDGTAEDWALLERSEDEFNAGLPERILGAVDTLNGSYGGYKVSRYTHSLQAATRAMCDGKDEEYVVRRSSTTSATTWRHSPTGRWSRRC
jgi:predicted HD phosphohydrolase